VEAHQLYLQGRFYENRHSKKVRASSGCPTNRRRSWIPGFALAGPESAGTNDWLAAFATEGGTKDFRRSFVECARRSDSAALSPSSPNLPEAFSPGVDRDEFSILTGTGAQNVGQGIGAGASIRTL
jgi:hypothetical protein